MRVVFLVLLAACSPGAGDVMPQPTPPAASGGGGAVGEAAIPPTVVVQHPASVPFIETVAPTPVAAPATAAASTPAPAPFRLCSPLGEHSLASLPEITSDPYHPPPPGREERHHGVDFAYYNHGGRAAIIGETVQAVFGGRAAAAIHDRFPYGNVVIIETPPSRLPPGLAQALGIGPGQSLYTLYAHMQDTPLVELDDSVDSCQALGAAGQSGNAGGAHLHLEMRIGPAGVRFPLMAYYHADATPDEREAYLRWRVGGEFNHFDPMLVLK